MGMSKAVAVYAIFLVVLIGLMIFFTFAILIPWMGVQNCESASLSCASKQTAFCTEWYAASSTFEPSAKPTWEGGKTCIKTNGDSIFQDCPEPNCESP